MNPPCGFACRSGRYLPFIFLLGAVLFYLIINQHVNKPGQFPNLLETKSHCR